MKKNIKIIAFVGNKGGVGKTALARLTAMGLKFDKPEREVFLLSTDPDGIKDTRKVRIPKMSNGLFQSLKRKLAGEEESFLEVKSGYIPNSDLEILNDQIHSINENHPGAVLVIDTGGGQLEIGKLLSSVSDLIVLPTKLDGDSLGQTISDALEFQAMLQTIAVRPKMKFIINDVPGDKVRIDKRCRLIAEDYDINPEEFSNKFKAIWISESELVEDMRYESGINRKHTKFAKQFVNDHIDPLLNAA